MSKEITAEAILDKILPIIDWDKYTQLIDEANPNEPVNVKDLKCFFESDLSHLIKDYAKKCWEDACEKTLQDIAEAFLNKNNLKKADRESDKDVFLAIGETIRNFPKPKYE